MSYRLETDESLSAGIKRIATEQVDTALEELATPPDGDRNEAVHSVRKRFKKIRAVLRLVRDEVGSKVYEAENVCYRNAGRRLAPVRDSFVMIETVDLLKKHFADQLVSDAFAKLREQLVAEHQAICNRLLEEEEAMAEVTTIIEQARLRVADWPIDRDDFSAVWGGLKRVYKRGRHRMADSYESPSSENFHEWRKRVKYLWYHTRILQVIWPNVLDELADSLHDLADYLGDDHDLAVLRSVAVAYPDYFASKTDQELLLALIDRRRIELETVAKPLGERIYSETPRAFVRRYNDYWDAFQTKIDAAQIDITPTL